MEQISTLVWKTERPNLDAIRKSPNFWLLRNEWNFTLQCYTNSEYRYKITLRKVGNFKLDNTLTVTVYIRGHTADSCCFYAIARTERDYSGPYLNGMHKTQYGGNGREWVVWDRSAEEVDPIIGPEKHYGKWTLTFIFYSNKPLTPQLSKEPGLATIQYFAYTQLSSASDAKNLSKAILSEDKCVQACSDIPPDLKSLSSDLRQLLERETFSDIKLRCGDQNISAHRSILAARSDVFTDMFRNKSGESGTATVDVTDVDFEVLDLLLKYVYSGKVPNLSDDTASRLYEAAFKYAIHALKKACSEWMVRNLTAENCLDYLEAADAYSDEQFKQGVVDFVAENLKSLKKDAWSKFNKDCASLANSVYQKRLASTLSEQA